MAKSRVAVIRVTPDTILSDIDRLVDLGGVSNALAPGKTTILKDNISWHFPFPAANTTPWQLEGTIQALAAARISRPGVRPEQDRRHQRLQGRRSQPLRSDFQALRHPRPLQLQGRRHDVGALRAESAHARARPHLPRRHPHPRLLFRQEHRPSADHQVPHLHDDHRRDEERVRRPAEHAAALHAFVDSRDARRSARDPEGDPLRAVRDHGRHDGRQRPWSANDVSRRQERDAGVRRPGRDRCGVGEDDGFRSDVAPVHPAGARGSDSASAIRERSRSSATSTRRRRTGSFTSARTWCASAAAI